MILVNKVNSSFPALTAPFPIIVLSSLSSTNEVSLVANLGKTSLPKGTAWPMSAFLPKVPVTLPNILPRNLPD